MAVGFIDRLRRLTPVVEMAELVWHPGQFLGHGLADGLLAVGDDASDGHGPDRADRGHPSCQILGGGGEQTLGQQHFA